MHAGLVLERNALYEAVSMRFSVDGGEAKLIGSIPAFVSEAEKAADFIINQKKSTSHVWADNLVYHCDEAEETPSSSLMLLLCPGNRFVTILHPALQRRKPMCATVLQFFRLEGFFQF
jgi:hypothetical protein